MTTKYGHRLAIMIGAAVVALILAACMLPLTVPGRDNSPDEAANRYFSTLFAEHGALWFYEPLNFIAHGAVHPRSMRLEGDFIVPGGFIGLPVLWGLLERAVGTAGAAFLTPFFASLAVLAFGDAVAVFLGRRVGVFAAILLAVQPVWWYWSSRTFMPNVPFLCFVIFAFWFAASRPMSRIKSGWALFPLLDDALAGASLAVALAIRASEVPWIFATLVVLAVRRRTALRLPRLAAAAIGFIALAVPFLAIHHATYGSFFATGYGSQALSADALPHGGGAALLGPVGRIIFPLGFAPRTALARFVFEGIGFHWWWSMLVIAAVALLAARRGGISRTGKDLAVVSAISGAWLLFFYGSYTAPDAANALPSIGMSSLRYWLPLFVISIVPVAAVLDFVASQTRGRRAAFAVLAAVALVGVAATFLSPSEGLVAVQASLKRDERIRQGVLASTEPNSVVVVDTADKFLFPSRRVIQPLRSDATFVALADLRRKAAVYYLGITFPPGDLEYLERVRLAPIGYSIVPVRQFGEQTLYRFTPTDEKTGS